MYKKIINPCFEHNPCELRGTDVCHNDKCPYGWAEFEKQLEENRQFKRGLFSMQHSYIRKNKH